MKAKFWRKTAAVTIALLGIGGTLAAFYTLAPAVYAQPAHGAPPPPSEGLDPLSAPRSSRDLAGAAPSASGDTHHSDDTEVDVAPLATDRSPAAVFGLDFMQRALVAGLLVGGACAFLGVYVVLRRIVFVGLALAEMSSAGVAFAILTRIAPMLGSLLSMLVGVGLVSVRWGGRRIRQDAFIGIGYVTASASSVLMLAKSPSGEGSLLDLLFGNILTVTPNDIWITALILASILIAHALFYKQMLFVAFDPDTAAASGYQSRFWELGLYLTIGLAVALAIHAVGVLLTLSSLIIAPVTALLVTKRLGSAFLVAALAGTLVVPIGLYVSFLADLPAAATIVGIGFIGLIIAGTISRLRH